MEARSLRIRGDTHDALNGLIREGVITAFETDFDEFSALGMAKVTVAADVITAHIPSYDRSKVLAVRNRVTHELEGVGATDLIVSVRSALPGC